MTPELFAVILNFAIEFGLPAAQRAVELFHKENPTLEDWQEVFAKAKTKSYDDYVAPKA